MRILLSIIAALALAAAAALPAHAAEQGGPAGSHASRASKLVGESVYSLDGERIGTIDDLVIRANDRGIDAVLSVGGFLGLGEKLVAIPFEQLQLRGNSVALDATKDSLKAQPDFSYAALDRAGDRDDFVREMEPKLEEWSARIDEYKRKAGEGMAGAKESAGRKLDEAWSDVSSKWTAVKRTGGAAWRDAKSSFEQAWGDLEDAWEDARTDSSKQ